MMRQGKLRRTRSAIMMRGVAFCAGTWPVTGSMGYSKRLFPLYEMGRDRMIPIREPIYILAGAESMHVIVT